MYHLFCCFSVTAVYVISLVGMWLNERPGLPTISRMFLDNPDFLPHLFVIFVVIQHELRSIASTEDYVLRLTQSRKISNGTIYLIVLFVDLLGCVQTICYLLIIPLDLDYYPYSHQIVAFMIVAVALIREFYFITVCLVEDKMKKIRLLLRIHVFFLIILVGFVFTITLFMIPNLEVETYYAFTEYLLFMFISIANCFYVGDSSGRV